MNQATGRTSLYKAIQVELANKAGKLVRLELVRLDDSREASLLR